MIVFKATVDRSTVLCSASIVIPATDTAGFQTIDMYHGTVADGHKVAQNAVLATCGRHPNLIVGIDELGRQLLGPSSGLVEVVAHEHKRKTGIAGSLRRASLKSTY